MTTQKKTLYEVLEVSPMASFSEIHTAHRRLSQNLELSKTAMNREDVDLKLKLVSLAFQTLKDQNSRDAYDAKLATHTVTPNVPAPINVDALSLKADAISLKADAAALKADAVLLKADTMALKIIAAPSRAAAGAHHRSPLKMVLTIIASLMAIGMVIQVVFVVWLSFNKDAAMGAASKAEEKVILQEYYQEHGVRPGSKTEADLLEMENKRKENELNELRKTERETEKQEREYQRFVEESRRVGEQVSGNLRRDQEREEQRAHNEAERKNQQLLREQYEREEAERRHVQNERRKLGLY